MLGRLETAPTLRRGTVILPAEEDTYNTYTRVFHIFVACFVHFISVLHELPEL